LRPPGVAIARHGSDDPPDASAARPPAYELRDHVEVTQPEVILRTFTPADLAIVEPWFRDSETRRWLGGPAWPAIMLDRAERVVGEEFRGAVQTAAYRYLARAEDHAFGYVDCGTFDRCTVYGGEGPNGPIVTDALGVATGSIAFVVDPALRHRGLGGAMIKALTERPEVRFVELFEAGVEPGNTACRRCLESIGFRLRSKLLDCEGLLYYRAWHAEIDRDARLSA
jgi:RimJ/RimL family protein N-acetyltransferase